jgi:hypothetical protein
VSAPTKPIAASGTAPVNTAAPRVDGAAREGSTLSATTGRWSGSSTASYAYQWERCDRAGKSCARIEGATRPTYMATSADVGSRLRVAVIAQNGRGVGSAVSTPTAPVVAQLRAGVLRLRDGRLSVPADSVSLPDRLVISGVFFVPRFLSGREPFTARFRVTDTRGNVVRDALVYAIGLPYGRVNTVREAATDRAGYVTFTFRPTARQPTRRGSALVFFVRARTPRGSILAGASTRRLVQVTFR